MYKYKQQVDSGIFFIKTIFNKESVMKKMGKVSAILSALLFAAVALTGNLFAADTIKLGVAGAHSGDLASYGLPSVKAAELVVKKINAKGGILGKQVELLVEDDVCKPEVAGNTATKLVSDGVDVVIGHICSGATKAALGIYKDSGIVTMSPSATNPDLTLSGEYPNFFRTIAHDAVQAQLQVKFATQVLKVKKIVILHDKGDYGKGQAELAQKYFTEAGVEVALFEGVTPGAMDYSAIVTKISRIKPDLVVWGGYHPEASKIISQMRKKRMKTNFIGGDGVKDDTFIKVAGKIFRRCLCHRTHGHFQ